MRFLILGAGALGGYFGGRLAEKGEDVTFLVRPGRAAQMAKTGLVIHSPHGNLHISAPQCIQSCPASTKFDVIILGCKAYDLDQSLDAIAPAVGPNTTILPILNGMRHIDRIVQRFGRDRVIGGLCQISAVLGTDGAIEHLSSNHTLIFGELDGGSSARTEGLAALFARCHFDGQLSTDITQDMWEKWVLIVSLAGITCLMRSTIGDIVAAGGTKLATDLFAECCQIASYNDHAVRETATRRAISMLTQQGSPFTASMLKDIERNAPTEADHAIGALLRVGDPVASYPLLGIVWTHLQAYENKRRREAAV
jgi:2-dehydropantoate 2-reductase